MNMPFSFSSESADSPEVEFCNATVFKVADHWFALPSNAILKVIASSALVDNIVNDNKLLLWNHHPLVCLDLHSLLSQRSVHPPSLPGSLLPQPLMQPKYVLIAWSPTGDRCAIPVDELPILVNIPLSEVQQLPLNYRQTISSIAKFMVALPYKGSVLTILLLNLYQVIHRELAVK